MSGAGFASSVEVPAMSEPRDDELVDPQAGPPPDAAVQDDGSTPAPDQDPAEEDDS